MVLGHKVAALAAAGRLRDDWLMPSIASENMLRALVTRPREEAEALAPALAERGVAPLVEPLMQIHFREEPPLGLVGVQAVLCTSANGVRALARASAERGVPLLAVGDATAARARAEGFARVTSAAGDVHDLVRLAAARLCPQGGRLLHIAGSVVAGDLAGALRDKGFAIDRVVLYEARPVMALSLAATAALRRGEIAFALFFSPRTAAVFARLAGSAEAARCCAAVEALSISASADAALARLPWRGRHVAEHPTQPALLDLLDRLLRDRDYAR